MPVRLVVFSDDWGRHPSSSQHLVRRLIQRYPTLWVNTIGTRSPRLAPQDVRKACSRLREWVAGARHSPLPNLTVLSPLMWPWLRSPYERRLNARLITTAVHRRLGPPRPGERRIAVTTVPITADLVGRLAVDRWVYYCVDDVTTWPGLDGRTLAHLERQQVQAVDSIIVVSEALRGRMLDLGREAYLLDHGLDLAHWTPPEPSLRAAPKESDQPWQAPQALPAWWSRLPRPIFLFWGLIDARLDAKWCRLLVTRTTQGGTLVLAGPQQAVDPALRNLAGLVRPGPVPYDQLPALAAAADVLVMPYVDRPVTRAMQPLKLKEYLATGKPVVVRSLPATRAWADAADVVKTSEQFIDLAYRRARSGVPAAQLQARKRLSGDSWDLKAQQFEALLLAAL